MADGAGGGGGFRPFEGTGTLPSLGNTVANEVSEFGAATKKQLGLNPKPKQLPKNLTQTQQLQQMQQNQQTEKDQKRIAKLNQEIQMIIQQHRQSVEDWDKKLIADEQQEEQEKRMQEAEEEKQKQEEEQKKLQAPVELPGSSQKMPGLFKKKKSTPLAVTQAVNKDIGRQAKG